MKKTFVLLLTLLSFGMLKAQEDMPVVWESRLDHTILYAGTGHEGETSYAASDKEMTLFDNATGKIIWSKAFKEMAPKLRKIDELIPFWASKTIFIFERKLGKDQIACVDLATGEALWTTDKYQDLNESSITYIKEDDCFAVSLKKSLVYIRARTGEELWSTEKFKGVVGQYVYDKPSHTMTMVNFIPGTLEALFSGFKNQIMRMNLATGEIVWENTYIGRAERKVISKEFLYELDVVDNKVFLRLNGMQVYDYATGAQLWSAAFDFSPDKLVGKPVGTKQFGVYGAVADPVIEGDDIYVLDMVNKKNQYVKKYDLNTGKLLWTSREIKDARAIPGMKVIHGKVILQIGGVVEVQYHRTYRSGEETISETAIVFENVKPNGIQAFNCSDGTLAWESERFKKGITNSISFGNNYIVCSGKELYSLDVASGKENFSSPVSKGGVGLAQLILPYKDNVIVVVGEKGISTFDVDKGDLIHSGKYRKSTLEDYKGDILVMKTDKADIGTFDLNTCNYKDFKARKGSITTLTNAGDFVYVYEKRTVSKLSTR